MAVGSPTPALRPEHLYRAVGLLFLLALLYRFFGPIAQALLLAYAAAILAIVLNPIVRRIPLERSWVAGLIGVVTLAAVGLVLWIGLPSLLAQARTLIARAPEFEAQLDAWGAWLSEQAGIDLGLERIDLGHILGGAVQLIGAEGLLGQARGLLQMVLFPLIILFGGLYALASPNERLLLPLLRLVPASGRPALYRIFQLLGARILGWMRGSLIAMLGVGLLASLAFYLIGVPSWLLLGVMNGLFEFIPIVGPWIGGVPAVLIAFLDDPTKGVWTAIAVIVIQQVESNLITPFAMSKQASIHPMVTLFALVLFGSLFGFLGVLLALPLVLFFWTVVEVLWVERAIDTDDDWIPRVVEE